MNAKMRKVKRVIRHQQLPPHGFHYPKDCLNNPDYGKIIWTSNFVYFLP